MLTEKQLSIIKIALSFTMSSHSDADEKEIQEILDILEPLEANQIVKFQSDEEFYRDLKKHNGC